MPPLTAEHVDKQSAFPQTGQSVSIPPLLILVHVRETFSCSRIGNKLSTTSSLLNAFHYVYLLLHY